MSNQTRLTENFKIIGYWELSDAFKSNKDLVGLNLNGIAYFLDNDFAALKDVILN